MAGAGPQQVACLRWYRNQPVCRAAPAGGGTADLAPWAGPDRGLGEGASGGFSFGCAPVQIRVLSGDDFGVCARRCGFAGGVE